jgi:DNA-binding transcriptional ArsR family regulator
MDLAREILLAVEANPKARQLNTVTVDGKTPEEVSYHIRMLDQAGLLEGKDMSTMGQFRWAAKDLTFKGHEFLDASREPAMWEKAKKLAVEKAGVLTFEVLKESLMHLAKSAIGMS